MIKSLERRSLFTEQSLSKFPYALNLADPRYAKTTRERSITGFLVYFSNLTLSNVWLVVVVYEQVSSAAAELQTENCFLLYQYPFRLVRWQMKHWKPCPAA